MPDNLVAALSEDELIDLVEYLLTLKTASLTPDWWHVVGPFANDAADSALDKDLGLEKHPAIDTAKPLDGKDGVILFGNDDGAKVWVNGEKVFENRDHLAAEPARHRVPVKLKKGPNAILIKIVNGNDPHGMYFALTSEQELKAVK
jgi:hypothetical protein